MIIIFNVNGALRMIALVPYDEKWYKLFLDEKIQLNQALTDPKIFIEHIVSTAIHCIYTKPTIDILVGVENLQNFSDKQIKALEALGYHYFKEYEKEMPNRRFFQKKGAELSWHVHVVNYHSSGWQRHILFRDYLQRYPKIAKEYETHKLELARHYDDSNQYAAAKNEFCRAIDNDAFHDFTINQPCMTTERLVGFIPQLACFAEYKNMMQDKTFIACYGVAFTEEQICERLVDDINHWDRHGFGPLMWYDKHTHRYIGRSGIKTKFLDGKEEVELAYAIVPDAWGKGLAMEMSRPNIDWAFNGLQLQTLICFTQIKNSQSLAVMKKLGFDYEKEFEYLNLPHILYRFQK